MHELSVCQALLIQAADIARARGSQAIECITIEVGALSGTEPDLLLSAFRVMRSGSAATARLVIKRCPVQIGCLDCGVTSATPSNRLVCKHCGGWRTRVIAGNELRLLRVQMRMPESLESESRPGAEQIEYV